MRRSAPHALLATLLAVAVGGCGADLAPTRPLAEVSANYPREIDGEKLTIDPSGYVFIVAGAYHTCATQNSGAIHCWGQNAGYQATESSEKPCASGEPCASTPVVVMLVRDTLRATQIAAGIDHTCILDPERRAWCWGDSHSGQVGNSVFGPMQPVRVSRGLEYTSIDAGGYSTCATSTEGVFCWGLFAGLAPDPTLVSSYNGYHAVVVGFRHACALLVVGAHRSVDCWGFNHSGQLGIDMTTVSDAPFSAPSQFGAAVNGVTTERDFTCVDQESGIVQCAGTNAYGTLGNGTWSTTGDPQTVGGDHALHGVTTGQYHACALDPEGRAWCWGNGRSGQLGNRSLANFNTPQPVAGDLTFRAIAAGREHTCAIATDNAIYCWGRNEHGQVGIGHSGVGALWTPHRVTDWRY